MNAHEIINFLRHVDKCYDNLIPNNLLEFRWIEIISHNIVSPKSIEVYERYIIGHKTQKAVAAEMNTSVSNISNRYHYVVDCMSKNDIVVNYLLHGNDLTFLQYLYTNADKIIFSKIPMNKGDSYNLYKGLEELGIHTLKQMLETPVQILKTIEGIGPTSIETLVKFLNNVDPSRKISSDFDTNFIYKVDPTKYGKLLFPNIRDLYHCRNWTFICRFDCGFYYMTDTYFKEKTVVVTPENEQAFKALFRPVDYDCVTKHKFEQYDESNRIGPVAIDSGGIRFPKYYVKHGAPISKAAKIDQLQKELDAVNARRDFIISELSRAKAEEV